MPQSTSFSPHASPKDNDAHTVCKEIRHNSTGCLKMIDQCDKCREILSVGESGASLQAWVISSPLGLWCGAVFIQSSALCLSCGSRTRLQSLMGCIESGSDAGCP
jgi:hypothetical protein